MFCKFSIKRDEYDEELIYFASVDIYVVKYRLEYRSIEDLEAASWPDGLSPPFPHSYAPTRKFPPKTNSFLRRDGLKGLPVARVHFSAIGVDGMPVTDGTRSLVSICHYIFP